MVASVIVLTTAQDMVSARRASASVCLATVVTTACCMTHAPTIAVAMVCAQLVGSAAVQWVGLARHAPTRQRRQKHLNAPMTVTGRAYAMNRASVNVCRASKESRVPQQMSVPTIVQGTGCVRAVL